MELYKKYRPKKLDRVVGNASTVKTLVKMLQTKNLPHTIMFHGPSGCGKTTLARCICNEMGCHLRDCEELNCADFRGIDTIRDIRERMVFQPEGFARVFILDEVHKITNDGQNALLKMLEDTPKSVYFILCTTEPKKVIATVRNRCSIMPVEPLSVSLLGALLDRICKREGIEVPEHIRADIIDASEGSPRKALVLLDKIRNLDSADYEKALEEKMKEERQAKDLCQALIKKESWRSISIILKDMRGNCEPENVRYAVLGYATSVLLNGENRRAALILDCFSENFYDSKFYGLVLACYNVFTGG